MTDEDINPGNWMKQYEAIRRSGKANMITEVNKVQKIAYESEFHSLVVKIEDCRNNDDINYLEEAKRASEMYRDVPDEALPDVAHKVSETWEK